MLVFDGEKEIFRPSAVCRRIDGFPRNLIVTWSIKVLNAFRKRFTTRVCHTFTFGPACGILKAESSDLDVGICLIPCGSPAAAHFMEQAREWGARRLVFVGSCGLLDRSVGDALVVPSAAVVDEGTSHHYVGDEVVVDVAGCALVDSLMGELGLPHVVGKVWTTDAVFRETPSAMAQAMDLGCICVDMECSAIASVARFRNMETYQFFFTADRLSSEGWDKGGLGKVDGAPKYIDFALKLIEKIDKNYIKAIGV